MMSPVTHINELGPQQHFVNYIKPALQDSPIDKQTKGDLDKLLDNNKDVFAEDERQIGTTPFIEMTTDTGDYLPIAKNPYILALKHYDWGEGGDWKLLEAGVIRESHSSWSAPIVVVPKGDGGKRLCVDYRVLNKITRTYISMSGLCLELETYLLKEEKLGFIQLLWPQIRVSPYSPWQRFNQENCFCCTIWQVWVQIWPCSGSSIFSEYDE